MGRKIVLAVVLTLFGLVAFKLVPNLFGQKRAPPKTVNHVDLSKYLGKWYEQSVIPFFFQRGCEKTTAKYSLNKDETIKVDNSCYRDGKLVESVGKAFPDPEDTNHSNAKLKVQFSQTFSFKADYWIVRLDKDYTYAVVSSPDYQYLWILYRQPKMPQQLYDSIYADLKKDGFSVQDLKRTVQ